MFKTIFRKQFLLYAATLVVSFALIALGLVSIFRTYFVQKMTDTMAGQGQRLAESYVRMMNMPTPGAQTQFVNDVQTLGYLGASCIFVDNDGRVVACTLDITSLAVNDVIDAPAVQRVLNGESVQTQGTLGGVFSENVLIVGYPIEVQTAFGETGRIGAVFMSASMAEVHQTTQDVIRMTMQCLLIALALSFVLVYITSKTISKPIHEVNQAAKIIAAGDFEKRLAVKSRDEVGQLADSFNNMAESLANQEKSRSEFIANISHDIRSPLTSMRGFLTAVMDGTIPTAEQGRYLQIVLDETERITKLANDILDISKIQSLDVEPVMAAFDVNELIRTTLMTFKPRVMDKKIRLTVAFADERNVVLADEEKIRRVIYNLMDNAVKFTGEGGRIHVETQVMAQAGKLLVRVIDDGKGISAEAQKQVFERFYKADASRGEDKRGSGLGLSIVRAFLQAHGETITLESAPGEGSRFAFTLTEA